MLRLLLTLVLALTTASAFKLSSNMLKKKIKKRITIPTNTAGLELIQLPAASHDDLMSHIRAHPTWFVHMNFDGKHTITKLPSAGKAGDTALTLLQLHISMELGTRDEHGIMERTQLHELDWSSLSDADKATVETIASNVNVDTLATQVETACPKRSYIKTATFDEVDRTNVAVNPVCGQCAPHCEVCIGEGMELCMKCAPENGQEAFLARLGSLPDVCLTKEKCIAAGRKTDGVFCKPDYKNTGGKVATDEEIFAMAMNDEENADLHTLPIANSILQANGQEAMEPNAFKNKLHLRNEEKKNGYKKYKKPGMKKKEEALLKQEASTIIRANHGKKPIEFTKELHALYEKEKIAEEAKEEALVLKKRNKKSNKKRNKEKEAAARDATTARPARATPVMRRLVQLEARLDRLETSGAPAPLSRPVVKAPRLARATPAARAAPAARRPARGKPPQATADEADNAKLMRTNLLEIKSKLKTGINMASEQEVGIPVVDTVCDIYKQGWTDNEDVHRYLGGIIFGYDEGEDAQLASELASKTSFYDMYDTAVAAPDAHAMGAIKNIAMSVDAEKSMTRGDSIWCQSMAIVEGLEAKIDDDSQLKTFLDLAQLVVNFLQQTIGSNQLIQNLLSLISDLFNWMDTQRTQWRDRLENLQEHVGYTQGISGMCDFSVHVRTFLSKMQAMCHVNDVMNAGGCQATQLMNNVGSDVVQLSQATLQSTQAEVLAYAETMAAQQSETNAANAAEELSPMEETFTFIGQGITLANAVSGYVSPLWAFLEADHVIQFGCVCVPYWYVDWDSCGWSGCNTVYAPQCGCTMDTTINIMNLFQSFSNILNQALQFLQTMFQPLIDAVNNEINILKTEALDWLEAKFNDAFDLDDLLVIPNLMEGFQNTKTEIMQKVNSALPIDTMLNGFQVAKTEMLAMSDQDESDCAAPIWTITNGGWCSGSISSFTSVSSIWKFDVTDTECRTLCEEDVNCDAVNYAPSLSWHSGKTNFCQMYGAQIESKVGWTNSVGTLETWPDTGIVIFPTPYVMTCAVLP